MTELSQEFLANVATEIWKAGAKRRKFKLWLSETTRALKGIDRKLDQQEESLIKSIRSGALDTETLSESDAKIFEYRKELKPWLEQILCWVNGEELQIEEKIESFEDAANVAEKEIKESKAKKPK
jgi:hypothetical protein